MLHYFFLEGVRVPWKKTIYVKVSEFSAVLNGETSNLDDAVQNPDEAQAFFGFVGKSKKASQLHKLESEFISKSGGG